MKISTIICTYNPRIGLLESVVERLLKQTGISLADYEIIVVDNNSPSAVKGQFASDQGNYVRLVREDRVGLTHARLRGLNEARGDVIVFVDDDNLLSLDYLSLVRHHFESDPLLGAIGGKAIPIFAESPPTWFDIKRYSLGCRDLGENLLRASWRDLASADRDYPSCSPIGGGMAVRRAPLEHYAKSVQSNAMRKALDRTGSSLASGGDNDIIMCVLELGFDVAYDPALQLDHAIPAGRTKFEYISRYQHDTMVTWVQVLDAHGIRPWSAINPVTLPLRKWKAYVALRAWASKSNYLDWKSACGMLAGRAAISQKSRI